MKKIKMIQILVIASFFLLIFGWNLFGPKDNYSESERRVLEKFPEITKETIVNGEFAKDFEDYAADTFPMRDGFRSVKAYATTALFAQKDNNDIYTAEGHISKLEYPMHKNMVEHALNIFERIQETYLSDQKVYAAVIPDKNRYLAEENGYLSMDYDAFSDCVAEGMPYAAYIEIADLLEADDYYKTDTHWKQECITDVAMHLAKEMGVEIQSKYEIMTLDKPFYGVYKGQSALHVPSDTIQYLTNETLEQVTLEGAEAVYDFKKAEGKDPYEMYLSGNQPVVTIHNPENISGRRLVMFRDSFGSAIAPLLVSGYSEIVLVDIRYISSSMLGEYVDFTDADVLFLYSTMMLNQSLAMK